ncbi:MAG: DNA replication/repair protein RecF [Ruminococcaceae bacterium]|nr:DNA replication/repair protein RecF [Oscillospiraceae bacterium]
MIVRRIEFERFRNLKETTVEFSDGVNVIRGQNAQGKSNILEGVYLFARGKSFRGAKAKEMILFGENDARIRMSFSGDNNLSDVPLEMQLFSDNSRKYYRRGAPLRGAREMIGNFRAVLFCPAHLSLAAGAPAVRRSYLDIALSQLSPAYIDELAKYQRLILHRNTLLKDAAGGRKVTAAEWESFALMIASFGARVAAARLRYTKMAQAAVDTVFSEMTDGAETVELSYNTSYMRTDAGELLEAEADKPFGADADPRIADGIVALYTDHIDREIRLGATLYGIHKDDIDITLNGNDAKLYASQGQQRSIALAMKLAEGELSRRISGEYPVFLLDDVLSELDFSRRSYVLSSLSDRQIIITSCDADLFRDHTGAQIINVHNGQITK